MDQSDAVFISETLAVTSFLFGLLGGFVSLALAAVVRFLLRRARSVFGWR